MGHWSYGFEYYSVYILCCLNVVCFIGKRHSDITWASRHLKSLQPVLCDIRRDPVMQNVFQSHTAFMTPICFPKWGHIFFILLQEAGRYITSNTLTISRPLLNTTKITLATYCKSCRKIARIFVWQRASHTRQVRRPPAKVTVHNPAGVPSGSATDVQAGRMWWWLGLLRAATWRAVMLNLKTSEPGIYKYWAFKCPSFPSKPEVDRVGLCR